MRDICSGFSGLPLHEPCDARDAVDISNRVTLFSRCLLMRYSQIVNHYHVLGQNRSVAVVSGERLPLQILKTFVERRQLEWTVDSLFRAPRCWP